MCNRIVLILALTLVPQYVLADQAWTPVVAKQRIKVERILPDGSRELVSEKAGDYLRTSTGKVLVTERRMVDGTPGEVVAGSLEDLAKGELYQLMYKSRKAIFRAAGRPGPRLTEEYKALAEQHAVDRQFVNGVWCLGFPVVANGEKVGVGWRSMDLDLHVKTETVREDNGEKIVRVREIYDIRDGVEPAPDTVRIPEDFAVVDGSTSASIPWGREK